VAADVKVDVHKLLIQLRIRLTSKKPTENQEQIGETLAVSKISCPLNLLLHTADCTRNGRQANA
jgi:hypothetical protein